jgi:GNAT superfamily N-acetyltransferase
MTSAAPMEPANGQPRFGHARVERVQRVDARLRERLLTIWTDVSNAGGWVGFVPPVDRQDVAPALDAALRRIHDGRDWLIVVRVPRATADPSGPVDVPSPLAPDDDVVAGFVILADNDRLLSEHWRWAIRVQIHPEFQNARLGGVLLDGAARIAADAGLEKLHLTVRGGEGLEHFYARAGYHEVARIPGAIRVAPGDDRDQVILARELGSSGAA